MSKTTNSKQYLGPTLIGGLLVAAGILAAVKLAQRERLKNNPESLIGNCEQALAKLVERVTSSVAA